MATRLLVPMCCLFALAASARAELADPTRPALVEALAAAVVEAPAAKPQTRWVLSLVRCADEDRRALLNGKLVREGDTLADARVVEILDDAVVIEEAGETRTVRIAGIADREGAIVRKSRSAR